MERAVPRRGRPKKGQELGERVQLSLRVTPELKKKLDQAAAQSGRSLSQEAEFGLERSFDVRRLLPTALELAYGRQLAGLLMVAGKVMADIGQQAGFMSTPDRVRRHDWLEDPFAYALATQALAHVVEALRPTGEPTTPKLAQAFTETSGVEMTQLAIGLAGHAIAAISGRSASRTDKEFAEEVRPLLGRLADVDDEERKLEVVSIRKKP